MKKSLFAAAYLANTQATPAFNLFMGQQDSDFIINLSTQVFQSLGIKSENKVDCSDQTTINKWNWRSCIDNNVSPNIAIFTQTLEDSMKGEKFENYNTYIMSSYVKYIEAQGARVPNLPR